MNYHKLGGFKIEIYSLIVLKLRVQNHGVGRATLCLQALRRILLGSPSLWGSRATLGVRWPVHQAQSLPLWSHGTVPVCPCLCLNSSLLIRTLVTGLGPTLVQYDLILI